MKRYLKKGTKEFEMRYHKIQLICPGRTYGQRTNLMELCLEGAYIREGKHFNLQSTKLLSVFQIF